MMATDPDMFSRIFMKVMNLTNRISTLLILPAAFRIYTVTAIPGCIGRVPAAGCNK